MAYLIALIAFENHNETSKIDSYAVYIFISLSAIRRLYKLKVTFTYYITLMGILGLFFLILFVLNNSPEYSKSTTYWFFTCFAIAFCVSNYIDNSHKFYLLLKFVVFAETILSIHFYYGFEIFELTSKSINGIRVGWELNNPNAIGVYSAFAIVLPLLFLINHKKYRIYYLANIIIIFPVLLLAGSKKSIAIIVLGFLLIFVINLNNTQSFSKKTKRLMVGILLLLLIYLLVENINSFWYIG